MRYLFFLILALLCHLGIAQQNLLEKNVSLNLQDVRLAMALAKLKSQYGLAFSYTNNLIPLDKKVSVQMKDKPLQVVLEALLENTDVTFSQVGTQVVLQKRQSSNKKPVLKSKPLEKKAIKVVERTETEKTDSPPTPETSTGFLAVPHLTSYEDSLKPSTPEALRQEYESEKRNLEKNYLAQLDAALESGDSMAISGLKKEFRDFRRALWTEYQRISRKIVQPFRSRLNPDSASNSSATSPVQISVFPPLSTNGRENENSINHFSLNLPVGYSGGLDGVEIGWLANIEKGNVSGVQVSGFTNVVKGDVEGLQYAGFLNWQAGRLEGVQVAGFLNVSGSDSSNAFQVSGFANTHQGDINGGQVAGFLNTNKGYVIGSQVSGFLNVAKGPISGAQVAGFANVNGGNINGAQVAGFLNVSRNTLGSQVAGFMNVAKRVNGSQIGIFNFADSVSGAQVGIISYARKGYRRLEFFGAEAIQANFAFRMGGRSFHNIFTIGFNPGEPKPKWSYGLGFGMEKNISRQFLFNADLVCNHVIENQTITNQNLNLLNQLKINFGYKPGRRTTIFAGPSANVAVSRVVNKETGKIGSDIIPDWAPFQETFGPTTVAIWVGGNIGIRF